MNHLFENNVPGQLGGHTVFDVGGTDLIARNIQRGRDHGIPPYIEFRKLWENKIVSDFEDLDDISDEVCCSIKKLDMPIFSYLH